MYDFFVDFVCVVCGDVCCVCVVECYVVWCD